jgi:hypothetical protein
MKKFVTIAVLTVFLVLSCGQVDAQVIVNGANSPHAAATIGDAKQMTRPLFREPVKLDSLEQVPESRAVKMKSKKLGSLVQESHLAPTNVETPTTNSVRAPQRVAIRSIAPKSARRPVALRCPFLTKTNSSAAKPAAVRFRPAAGSSAVQEANGPSGCCTVQRPAVVSTNKGHTKKVNVAAIQKCSLRRAANGARPDASSASVTPVNQAARAFTGDHIRARARAFAGRHVRAK